MRNWPGSIGRASITSGTTRPERRSRTSTSTPVLFDSGVRTGSDVVKALALGATAVGIGRPYAWGLALDGTDGIIHVLRCLLAEADLLMAIDGYPTIADLRSATLLKS
jgi:lactate 2-monooxygenase